MAMWHNSVTCISKSRFIVLTAADVAGCPLQITSIMGQQMVSTIINYHSIMSIRYRNTVGDDFLHPRKGHPRIIHMFCRKPRASVGSRNLGNSENTIPNFPGQTACRVEPPMLRDAHAAQGICSSKYFEIRAKHNWVMVADIAFLLVTYPMLVPSYGKTWKTNPLLITWWVQNLLEDVEIKRWLKTTTRLCEWAVVLQLSVRWPGRLDGAFFRKCCCAEDAPMSLDWEVSWPFWLSFPCRWKQCNASSRGKRHVHFTLVFLQMFLRHNFKSMPSSDYI